MKSIESSPELYTLLFNEGEYVIVDNNVVKSSSGPVCVYVLSPSIRPFVAAIVRDTGTV